MIAVAQKMEYVLEDSRTKLPTTHLWGSTYPNRTSKTPEFIKNYIEKINTTKNPSILIDMLMSLRKSENFRTSWSKLMVTASKQYDTWTLPKYAIGIKLTIIFKFPVKWGIPDWLVWESSYNTYTKQIEIGMRRDPNLDYRKW